MNKLLITVLVLAGVLGISAILFARTKQKTSSPPVQTAVTVAIEGFHCPTCPEQLTKDLAAVPGISNVRATLEPGRVVATLDETKTTASDLVSLISNHPRAMNARKTYAGSLLVFIDTEMCRAEKTMCAACFTEIPRVLKTVKGVETVTLDKTGKIAAITFRKGARVLCTDIGAALNASSFHFSVAFTSAASATSAPSNAKGGCCSENDAAQGRGEACPMSANSTPVAAPPGEKSTCPYNGHARQPAGKVQQSTRTMPNGMKGCPYAGQLKPPGGVSGKSEHAGCPMMGK